MTKNIYTFLILLLSWSIFANAPLSKELPYSKNLKFIENKGQWENFVNHKIDIPNGKVFLQKNRITYTLCDTKKHAELREKRHDGLLTPTDSLSLHSFHVNFLNSNN